jgi:queuosine precursor transporter
MLVGAYLAAIVVANLVVTAYGPGASIITAFALIGFDLTVRDRLHERWQGRELWPRMLALIAAGGLLSWLVNGAAGPIALASTVAFIAAGIADALAFAALGSRSWLARVNGSNVVGSAVDSLVFPTIAFGGFLPLIVVGQFVAKVAGGFLWSLVLRRDPVPFRVG